MRKQRWIAPVWGMLATAAFGQAASAQAPGSPLDGPFPPAAPPAGPGVAPGVPYPGNPTYTPIAPDAASPAGFPPARTMNPWPAISPYDHAYDSTYNQDGIWFREMLGHDRKYKISADFISGRFRQPGNAVIGADVLATVKDPFENDLSPASLSSQFDQDLVGVKDFTVVLSYGRYFPQGGAVVGNATTVAITSQPPLRTAFQQVNIFPVPPQGTQQGGGQGGQGTGPVDWSFPDLTHGLAPVVDFNATTTSSVTDAADNAATDEVSGSLLFTVTGGVLAEDASPRFGGFDEVVGTHKENSASPGMKLVFGLEDEDQSGFDITGWWLFDSPQKYSRGLDDPDRPRLTNIVLFESGYTTSQINAPGFGASIPTYEVLDYNQLFRLRNETTAGGSDLALYHTPAVDYGWLVLRPLYGARYNYIGETFDFTGRDNGLFVVYQQNGAPQGSIGGVGKVFTPNPAAPIPYSLFPYETSVTSKVQSHLYGPQVGLDMQLGGEYFMINSAAKTGIVANTEKLSMSGYGFGIQEALTGQRAFFADSKTHTRVAPFLEFNANADINVFPIIPYVNRSPFFKNARVNAGWSTLVVGNIQRPIDQIAWKAESAGGPHIQEKGRDAWYVQYWNVGVHWKF